MTAWAVLTDCRRETAAQMFRDGPSVGDVGTAGSVRVPLPAGWSPRSSFLARPAFPVLSGMYMCPLSYRLALALALASGAYLCHCCPKHALHCSLLGGQAVQNSGRNGARRSCQRQRQGYYLLKAAMPLLMSAARSASLSFLNGLSMPTNETIVTSSPPAAPEDKETANVPFLGLSAFTVTAKPAAFKRPSANAALVLKTFHDFHASIFASLSQASTLASFFGAVDFFAGEGEEDDAALALPGREAFTAVVVLARAMIATCSKDLSEALDESPKSKQGSFSVPTPLGKEDEPHLY